MNSVSLGPLEQEVMKCIWQQKKCTVRSVTDCLNQNRKIAYNTVQTIMNRLTDKKILKRTLKGHSYTYQPQQNKKTTLQSAIKKSMSGFMNQFGEEALLAFIDGFDDISNETRKKLIQKLQENE